MIKGQDVKSGYGQEKKKPNTSVLPYLRAQEKKREKIAIDTKSSPKQDVKTEIEGGDDEDRCVAEWLKLCGYGR